MLMYQDLDSATEQLDTLKAQLEQTSDKELKANKEREIEKLKERVARVRAINCTSHSWCMGCTD